MAKKRWRPIPVYMEPVSEWPQCSLTKAYIDELVRLAVRRSMENSPESLMILKEAMIPRDCITMSVVDQVIATVELRLTSYEMRNIREGTHRVRYTSPYTNGRPSIRVPIGCEVYVPVSSLMRRTT